MTLPHPQNRPVQEWHRQIADEIICCVTSKQSAERVNECAQLIANAAPPAPAVGMSEDTMAVSDIEQAFILRLDEELIKRGVDTSNWDGDDDPAEIIATGIVAFRDMAVEKIREDRETLQRQCEEQAAWIEKAKKVGRWLSDEKALHGSNPTLITEIGKLLDELPSASLALYKSALTKRVLEEVEELCRNWHWGHDGDCGFANELARRASNFGGKKPEQ